MRFRVRLRVRGLVLGPWALGQWALRGAQGPDLKNMRFRRQRPMRFRVRVRVRVRGSVLGPGALRPSGGPRAQA